MKLSKRANLTVLPPTPLFFGMLTLVLGKLARREVMSVFTFIGEKETKQTHNREYTRKGMH